MAQKTSLNLGLPEQPLTDNPELWGELLRVYNSLRGVATALDTYTGALQQDQELWSVLTPLQTILAQNQHRLYVQYSETISVGQIVTLWNDAGTLKARKAGGNPWNGDARGYCSVVAGVNAGDYGEVILCGLDPYVAGATPGTLYYLSNTVTGAISAVKPTGHGDKIQPIGFALSDSLIFFNPSVFVPTVDATSLAIGVLVP